MARTQQEVVAELEAKLEAAPPDTVERIDALNALAWELGLHDTKRARTLASEALDASKAHDYPRGEAFATRTLGYVELLASELASALETSKRAAKQLEALGETAGEASALNVLAVTYSRIGDFDKSLEYGLASLEKSEEAKDRRGEAWSYVELGNVHMAVGDVEDATRAFEKARSLFEADGYGPGLGRVHALLGAVTEKKGDLEGALAHYEKSVALGEANELFLSIAGGSAAIGRVHHTLGNRREARQFYERALSSADAILLKEMQAAVRVDLGKLDQEDGRHDEALAHLTEALRRVEGLGLRRTESRVHQALAELYEGRGELSKALQHYKKFQALRDEFFGEEGRVRLKNLQIQMGVEKAEREAEIERLRFVELAGMQTQLIQSEKMALLGRLVAGLSHEINTPIGVIRSNTSIAMKAHEVLKELLEDEDLAARLESRPEWRRAMRTIESMHVATDEASKRIATLIKSLKSYSRLDEAELQRVDISQCVDESLQLFETQLPEGITLDKELEPMPEAEARPGQLNQAFMTLLVNAREAIDGEGTIRVRSYPDEDTGTIEISDTGRGIPEAKLGELFEINFATKDSQVRLRMGLSNAKAVIEKHGGTIDVESIVSVGTTFRIRLPLRAAPRLYFGAGLPGVLERT